MAENKTQPQSTMHRRLIRVFSALLLISICGFLLLSFYDINGDRLAAEPQGRIEREKPIHQQQEERVPATLMSLVRNEEAEDIVSSIIQIEAAFNHKYKYPWTFFNDQEFSEEFKQNVTKAVAGNFTFVKLDAADWEQPEWIDPHRADIAMQDLLKENIQYADKISYHRMCRWNSGPAFTHPALAGYKYYWRVEPKTSFFCDVDYDVFRYMADNDKVYGFVINIYDEPKTIRTLWPTSVEFFDEHPDYLSNHNSLKWLTHTGRPEFNSIANGYSTCHFWSNFEVGSLDFFRSKKYQDYFSYLDRAGGFFYERWGDAPVHAIAVGMMADRDQVHYFKDIGYFHFPYYNCPDSVKCQNCEKNTFTGIPELQVQNCLPVWQDMMGY